MATATAARERAAAAGDKDALNRLKGRRPAEETVALAVDDTLVQAWKDAKAATFTGRTSKDTATRTAAEDQLAAARAELEAQGLVLWQLRNKGRKEYDRVQRECPPSDAERAENKARGQGEPLWSQQTFPAALVVMCTVGDLEGITAEDLTEMMDDGRLSEGEVGHLFAKAIGLYTGTRIPDLGK
jgi:hypothetical protein